MSTLNNCLDIIRVNIIFCILKIDLCHYSIYHNILVPTKKVLRHSDHCVALTLIIKAVLSTICTALGFR